jgi:hypothetical protein
LVLERLGVLVLALWIWSGRWVLALNFCELGGQAELLLVANN